MTLREVARVLSALERSEVTAAQVRSVLVVGTNGRALVPRQRGRTRLYTAVDVALARLALRLRAAGVSPTVARVLVANLRETLTDVWHEGTAMTLAVFGLRGVLLSTLVPRDARAAAWVNLRDVWRGIPQAVAAVRAAEPEVWRWTSRPVGELQMEASHGE